MPPTLYFIILLPPPPPPPLPPVWLQILILTEQFHFTWRSHPTKDLFYLDPHVAKAFQVHILMPQVISFQIVTLSKLHFTSAPHTITPPCHFRSTHHQSFISLQILTPPKLISDPHDTEIFISLQILTPPKLISDLHTIRASFHFRPSHHQS